ncbi:MAG: class I SAM-dependent methyltransferase [Pseudomonadota bacterium]
MQAPLLIDDDRLAKMQDVEDYKSNSDYNSTDINGALDYMKKLYVDPMRESIDIAGKTLCDCASGYGWLGLACLFAGGARAVFVEPHPKKLNATRRFAEILGLSDRCVFKEEYLQDISLEPGSVDIFASIETLEHVGKANVKPSLEHMERLTKEMIVLTTPNQIFPVVSHDGVVPFAHWLPKSMRGGYVKALGRKVEGFNDFVSPWDLGILNKRFRPVSTTLTFTSHKAWRDHYPCYTPYGCFWRDAPNRYLSAYLKTIEQVSGRSSYWLSPNLASVWLSKDMAS